MTQSEARRLKSLGRLDLCPSTQPAQVGVQIPSPSFTPSPISFGDLDFKQHASYVSRQDGQAQRTLADGDVCHSKTITTQPQRVIPASRLTGNLHT